MEPHLIEQEKEQLREMRFTAARCQSELSIEVGQLIAPELLSDYLWKLSSMIGAPDPKTAGSVFMKRYAYLALIFLYSMTVFNKRLDVSFDNVSLETLNDQDQWLPKFYLKRKTAVVSTGDRGEWRRESLKQLFAEHLFPLMNHLIKETKISKLILWENVAIYIYWLYEKVLFSHEDTEIIKRAKEDFLYLINEAPGDIFGNLNHNPLKKYDNDPVFIREYDGEIRIRTTCCFYYRLKNSSGYCKTCPQKCNALMRSHRAKKKE